MKTFFKFLILLFLAGTGGLCFAQQNVPQTYNGIPVEQNTTNISQILPYTQKVALGKNFVQKQINIYDPIRKELREVESRLLTLQTREQIPSAAPMDKTRVVTNTSVRAYSSGGKSPEEQKLLNKKVSLEKQLKAAGTTEFIQLDPTYGKINKQQIINDAFDKYKASTNMEKCRKLPEFKKTPAQLQASIAAEFKNINEKLKTSPSYKSYMAIERELERINKNKRDDGILMSIFTIIALRNFSGISVAAPATKTFWTGLSYLTKRIANFAYVIAVYSALDEANLRVINTSSEELWTRLFSLKGDPTTALQNNNRFLERIIKDGSASVYGNKIPSAWSSDPYDTAHHIAVKRFLGLKVISAYLEYSTVSYKYDLAMLDIFNLFSDQQNVMFDVNVFEQWEIKAGEWVQVPGAGNSLKINAAASLVTRTYSDGKTSHLIQNLQRLPKFLYYKKEYYQSVEHKGKRENIKLNPQYIIRDKDGKLIDCGGLVGFSSGGRGKHMEFILDGLYLMKIVPDPNPSATSYRGKPKTYVYEDINTKDKTCNISAANYA